VLVFFVIIVAYSLIIGRDNTLKVILGTYVAMIASDATGALFERYFNGTPVFAQLLKFASVANDQEAVVFVKVIVFVILVILFAVRGAFHVDTVDDRSALIRLAMSLVYAAMSAGLIISAILVFVSGASFIGNGTEGGSLALWTIYNKSQMIESIVRNSYFWFSIPALSFLIHSLYSHEE